MFKVGNSKVLISTAILKNKRIEIFLNIDEYDTCYHLINNGKLEYAHTVFKVVAKKFEDLVNKETLL